MSWTGRATKPTVVWWRYDYGICINIYHYVSSWTSLLSGFTHFSISNLFGRTLTGISWDGLKSPSRILWRSPPRMLPVRASRGGCSQLWLHHILRHLRNTYIIIYILYKSQSFVWSMVNRFPILCSVRFCFVCLFVLKSLGLVLCANTTPPKKLLNTWFESCFLIVNCDVWIPWFSGI